MDGNRWKDRLLQRAKHWQERYYASAYEELRRNIRWMKRQDDAFLVDKVFSCYPPKESVRSILIFKPDEIGDAVYALPAIAELRAAFPLARLILMCQKKVEPVYARSQLLDEIVPVTPRIRFRRFPVLDLKEAMGRVSLRQIDVAIFLRTYPGYFRQFLKIPAKFKVHPRDPRMKSSSVLQPFVELWTEDRVHQKLQMLQIVGPLIRRRYALGEGKFPGMVWTEEDERAPAIVGAGERYLAVHPFADFETRRYPFEYWDQLFDEIRKEWDLPIVVVGGPQDPKFRDRAGLIQAQGKLKLGQTGFLLSRAVAMLGNLSGPAHWASSMGTPTIMLMSGHSAFSEWAPLGNTLVLRNEVACSPCHLRSCTEHNLACLKELTPERVTPSIRGFLRALASRDAIRAPSTTSPTLV